MVGQLSREEIEVLLRRHRVGRIGYCIDGWPHIVPVNYVYDGCAVFVVSGPGEKIDAMRAHPRVCFEVDDIDGAAIWRSLIANGIYEELTYECERRAALALIKPLWAAQPPDEMTLADDIIVFRIRLLEKRGRFGRER